MPSDPSVLAPVLRNNPTYKAYMDGGTGQDLTDLLAALNLQDRPHFDNTLRNVEYFYANYTPTLTRRLLDGFIKQMEVDSLVNVYFQRLITEGLNFNGTKVRELINTMADADAWDNGVTDLSEQARTTLLALGRWNLSHAEELFGKGTVLVAQDILDAKVIYDKDGLSIQMAARVEEVAAGIADGTLTDWAAVRAALGAE